MVPQVDMDEEKEREMQDAPMPGQHIPSQQANNNLGPPPPQAPSRPLVKHGRISKDHPIDTVIGSPSRGVSTRSRNLASFCEHFSFVSCVEPTCVEEALKDSEWSPCKKN